VACLTVCVCVFVFRALERELLDSFAKEEKKASTAAEAQKAADEVCVCVRLNVWPVCPVYVYRDVWAVT